MSNTVDKAPPAKSGRRNRKKEPKQARPEQAMPPPDLSPDFEPQPVLAAEPPVETAVAPPEPAPIEMTAPADAGPAVDADAPAEPEPVAPEPVNFQTIARAYGDFTRKSLEDTRSFVEQLSGARSLDRAMEVQTEFARHAYQSFMTQAQRIRSLHSEMARQTLKPLEKLISKTGCDSD